MKATFKNNHTFNGADGKRIYAKAGEPIDVKEDDLKAIDPKDYVKGEAAKPAKPEGDGKK